jgi:peptidyl-prolyl cis-trans isomerase B (cyclophilin B)
MNKLMNDFTRVCGLSMVCFSLSTAIQAQNSPADPPNRAAASGKNPIVEFQTDKGKIRVRLYNETPKHRDNMLKLVKDGFYDGILFHRVIRDFMIQGGDPQSKNAPAGQMLGSGDVGYTVPAEFNPALFHKKGALSAARQGDQVNPEKRSSGCQFYLVQGRKWSDAELNSFEAQRGSKFSPEQREAYKMLGGTPHLDGGYTVYGEVIQGLEIIDLIAAVKTAPGDRPVEDVKIVKAVIVQ